MSDAGRAAAHAGTAAGAGAAGAGAGAESGAHGSTDRVQAQPTQARSTQFGQVVLGPPGAGKTTYCNGMHQFLTALGRPCVIVNLDPANDGLPFDVGVDVMELISLEDVMEEFGLGPNGGLMYCMEFLEANFDWLLAQLAKYPNTYFLFDCPGQVELYTHHESITHILERLNKEAFRLAAVHLVDAQHCKDGGHFISMALTSLATMMRLELPHVNVLSKIDLFQRFGMPPLSLDSYTRVSDLHLMASMIDRTPTDADSSGGIDDLEALFDEDGSGSDGEEDGGASGAASGDAGGEVKPRTFAHRFRKLNRAIVDVLDDYSMVGYRALDIRDKDSVAALLKVIDKSNGYAVGYLGEPARDLESMPEFGRWDDEVAMERVAKAAEVEAQVTQPVTEEPAARGQ